MNGNDDHFDALETRSAAERERELFESLPAHLQHARAHAPAYGRLLDGLNLESVTSREALARLPLTRKSALVDAQRDAPPFGGYAPPDLAGVAQVFASPGPIFEPAGYRTDYWRLGRALYAAGFRRGDLVHNTFSYHFTPAGAMLESGALAIGCAVFPAGTGQTELQVQAIGRLRPAGYTGTPSFLGIILDKARETGHDVASLRRALVSGEALPASLRAAFEDAGIRTRQCYATADLGLIAYESEAGEGLIVDEQVIVEIVRPGSGDPVPDGEVGEVVVTPFNPDYPLVRFATGDLSAVLPGTSPCGRTNMRIKGWMGRADQTTKVRGMFVHPSQVQEVARRHPEVGRVRLVIDRDGVNDVMTLRCETAGSVAGLETALAESIREVCKLRGAVELVNPGSLPNDGKVIDDVRTYE